MNSDSASRQTRLDNRLLVLAVFVGAIAIYLTGALRSAYPYSDARFVIGYFSTELMVAAWLLLTTALWIPPAHLGLRWPQLVRVRQLLPPALLLLPALAAWVVTRLSLPADAVVNNDASWLILRTTLLVGVTEEWIFRGLMLAALCRWLGLRRGAFGALLLFGCFHLMNIAAGVPPAVAAVQLVTTILLGSTFLLAALATRSLLLPMLGHGLYDFRLSTWAICTLTPAPARCQVPSWWLSACVSDCSVWSGSAAYRTKRLTLHNHPMF